MVSEGRSTATAIVAAKQNGKRCITVTVLLDVPTADVIRHHLPRPEVAPPADANVSPMPMVGRELRLVDVVDVNSPDEVGPPELYAWLHYDPIPTRDDLAKALVAYFTGHLGISTTMRAHEGIGTAQSHLTVSTAPMTVSVSFHEPVRGTAGSSTPTRALRSVRACRMSGVRCTPRRVSSSHRSRRTR